MIDDFALFHDANGASSDDADIGLITAYLARELSPVQIAAVQDRLETDAAFRARVQPVIESWVFPGSFRAGATRRAGLVGPPRGAGNTRSPLNADRVRMLKRIAAAIALIVLPMLTFAQVVLYAARNPDAPGHGLAQSIVGPLQPAKGGGTPPIVNDKRPGSQLWGRILASSQPGQPKPAHALGAVVATSSITLGSAAQFVSLSDGRVLVADPVRRLLQLFDANLANPKIVLDSAWGQPNTFSSGIGDGTRPSAGGGGGRSGNSDPSAPPRLRNGFANSLFANHLVPFRGDSSLWFDAVSQTFVVIDPLGKITRTVPPPPLISLTDWRPNPPFSWGGGLVYKLVPIGLGPFETPTNRRPTEKEKWPKWNPPETWNGPDTMVVIESDSLMVVRTYFGSTRIDTVDVLGFGMVTKWEMQNGGRPMKGGGPRYVLDPFRFVDDVVTTSDGYVVTLHAREYRLLWTAPDGQHTSQKLTYPWRRITDDMRRVILDSVGKLTDPDIESPEENPSAWLADSTRFGRPPVNVQPPLRVSPETRASLGRTLRNGAPAPPPRPVDPTGRWLTGQVFPDYFPPVPVRDALRADEDGNVWIQQKLAGNPNYAEWEVVSRTQGSIDRVRIPLNRTIAGFGKGGIVYLIAYDAGVARLEKVRVK